MENLYIAAAAFILAGFVKGVLGFGFPIIAIAILTLATGLLDALALVVLPALVTNLWQAVGGQYLAAILLRMRVYFLMAVIGILVAGRFLSAVDTRWLTGLLGVVLFFLALSRLVNLHFTIPARRETPLSVLLGFCNGVLTGFTGVFMVPSVLYMQALGFSRDMLVQAMGVFFALSTATLMLSLGSNQLLDWGDVAVSAVALVPSFAGMAVGRWVRTLVNESLFQKMFLVSVLILGAYIAWRALGA